MKIPFIQWLIQGIPECLAIATMVLALAGHKLKFNKILIIGLSLAVFLYTIRLLPLSFGVHTILAILSLAILVNLNIKSKFSLSLLISLVAYINLAIVETILTWSILTVMGMSFEQALDDMMIRIVISLPQVFVIFLTAVVISKYRNKIIKTKETPI